MKRAIIYARVSSKRQADDGLPVESQLQQCREKAAAMGAEVLQEFVDGGISGTTDKRPAFQAAIGFSGVMDVDYFITWSSSRFARNVVDAHRYKLALQASRTKLVYVSGGVDTSTDDGWLLDGFNALLDENYSRRVSTDTRRSMLKASRDGYFMGGRVPFGYRAAMDGKRRRLEIQEEEGAVVREIFAQSFQGVGVKIIAMTLNTEGKLNRGKRWAKNTLNFMLNSEIYTGISIFNRRKNRVENPPEAWIRVQSHPGIVDEQLFKRVQAGLEDRKPSRVGGTARAEGVFAGLLRCGECGGALTMTNGTSRTGERHHYYGCCTHMRGKAKCEFKNVRVDVLDPWLVSEMLDKVLTPITVQNVIRDVTMMSKSWTRDRQLRREALVKEMRATEAKRSKLYSVLELLGKDAPNLGDIGPRLRELNDQLKALEQSIIRLEEEPAGPNEISGCDPELVAELLRSMVSDSADPKKQRTFMASFIEKATVSGETVAVYYNEGRLMSLGGSTVRSEGKWLLNLGSNQGPTD